jgi:hypothetical protein
MASTTRGSGRWGLAVLVTLGAHAWPDMVSGAQADTAADHSADGMIVWSVAGMELGATAAMTYMFAAPASPVSSGRAMAGAAVPIGASIGAALLAAATDAGPRGGYAVHGAIWGALGAGALGMVLDGDDDSSGVRAGPNAKILAFTGAVVGGAVGALIPDDRIHPAFIGAPLGAALGTMVVGGIAMMVTFNKRPGRPLAIALGAATLGALAVGTAAALAADPVELEPAGARRTAGPPRPIMFSLGGSY